MRPIVCVRALAALASLVGAAAVLAAQGGVSPPADPAVIPFELYGDRMFVQVTVADSQPMTFLLDSGSSASLMDRSLAERLHLPLAHDQPARGVGEGRAAIAGAGRGSFMLGSVRLLVPQVYAFDMSGMEAATGRRVAGVIGADLFRQFVVEIDPSSRTLRLYPPNQFAYSARGQRLAIRVTNGLPYVQGRLMVANQVSVPGEFLVDTGQGRALSINKPFVDANHLLRSLHTVPTFATGMGGSYRALLGRIPGFQFGPTLLTMPPADLSQATAGGTMSTRYAGRLGMAILTRFKLIFDYRSNVLQVEPLATAATPFDDDTSGAVLFSDGPYLSHICVLRVIERTGAADAGFEPGDVILAIDDRAAIDIEDVRQAFRKPGQVYRVLVARGDQEIELTLTTHKRP